MDLTTRLRRADWKLRSPHTGIWEHPAGASVMPHPTNGGCNWYAPGPTGALEMGCEPDVDSAKTVAERTIVLARKAFALRSARELSDSTGREHVVREDYGSFHVCPRYMPGREGYQHDAGYSALGVLVQESINTLRP